ncbi:MAG: peptidyl-prolyl cis-trans isomerase [Bacteroidia bacterium]|nr:peptidyl-prolyl cis-trans isomerase [Bacteroidia bacterium]
MTRTTSKRIRLLNIAFGVAMMILMASCTLFKNNQEREVVARVGDNYLYADEIDALLEIRGTKEDSAVFVSDFINNWAVKQLLVSKAQINLPESKLEEFERLVANYRTDLYTGAYKEALAAQGEDTLITVEEMKAFYEEKKENFKLKEKIVQIRFIELPKPFLNKSEVIRRLKRFEAEDVDYLDSVGVQFRKLNFNDSLWIPASRVIEEIPPLTIDNESRYLKNSQFFELEDSLGVYLARINGVLQVNDVAPLSYISETIGQVLRNRRKQDYLNQLETEIIDEATKNNEFEVYASEQ